MIEQTQQTEGELLTPRQTEVLKVLAVEDMTRKEAAYQLGVTLKCIEAHVYEIRRRLGGTRTDLETFKKATKLGII